MTSAFSWQNSISLCLASFRIPRSNLPVTPGVSWRPTFAFQSHIMKKTSFWVIVLKGLVGLHRTIQFQFLLRYWLGHRLSIQFSSVTQSCPTLCDPMNHSTPGLLVHHQLPEFTQTHVHRVSNAIRPSHPLSSPSPAPNPSQHQSLFQWVNSSHEVAKVLELT